MNEQTIEAEGPSLEAARIVLQQKLQSGHVIIKETVLSDGSSKKVSGSGSSLEQARQQAQSKIPPNATIEKVNVIREPTTEVLAVEAFDEGEARKKAGVSLPRRIESISIAQAGRKGIFGIGRSPSRFSVIEITQSRFSVTITAPAEVEFIYRPPVTIRAIAATPVLARTTEWTASNGETVQFKEKYSKQSSGTTKTYEEWTAPSALAAEEYLNTRTIGERNYYLVVETPDGHWGKDVGGPYLEECSSGPVFGATASDILWLSTEMYYDCPKCERCERINNNGKTEFHWHPSSFRNTPCVKCGHVFDAGPQVKFGQCPEFDYSKLEGGAWHPGDMFYR